MAQKIAIDQVELSTILSTFEISVNNVVSLFVKLSDTSNLTKEIKNKLSQIDTDLKASAHRLSLDPSTSPTHFVKIRYLTDLQAKLLREEARIRATLVDIQSLIIPNMNVMHKHIVHAKKLIYDNNFSIADHMMELLAKVQIALHASKILQENWDKTMSIILKVHSDFLSHFGITLCIILKWNHFHVKSVYPFE